ncbi:MAG: DUF3858 domain-containing protein [Salinivirgaceae bacterium]
MIRIIISLLHLLFISTFITAQNAKYPASEIPDVLKVNADAVVRYHVINKEITSDSRVITNETYVVTIFNKSAQKMGYFYEGFDKTSSISGYSVKLYNSLGETLDKTQTKDFKDVKAYDGFSLFDENRLLYYQTFYNYFPYTVEINFTRTDKQTFGIGGWYPVYSYNIAVQFSSFTLTTETSNNIRFQEKNLPNSVKNIPQKTKIQYYWELKDYQAIDEEPFMPDYIFPSVTIAPNSFNYAGYVGIMTNWESYGKWIWDLIKDRDNLKEETVAFLKTQVDTISSEIEKVRYFYKYLQDNTHYVSIQLGIGGWQPFDANLVNETKYGDCKALSNYMKALLKAVNIESDYAIIRAGKYERPIDTDFPSNQFNHVILCVPNKGDTIWLECTNQRQPFGYLGSFTENRDVFLIKENDLQMVKTTEYTRDMNTQFSKNLCTIDSLGNAQISNQTIYQALQFENVFSYFHISPKEQKEGLYKEIDIPNTTITSFTFDRNNEPIPLATRKLELSITNYSSLNGNRMLIPVNPLNAWSYIPEKIKTRTYPVVLRSCSYDADTITFQLPSNYKVEYLPEPVKIENNYGEYVSQTKLEDGKVTYIRSLKLNKGTFPAEDYDKVRSFYKAISTADANKIVLVKKL